MKCIILAAGYATRLYPLTKNTAKPLLKVAGKTIMNHIMEKVEEVDVIDEIFIVTNDKFYASFQNWANDFQSKKTVHVINDQTTTNDNRLGAIADIQYVLDQAEITDDLMVLAGDNLFEFQLKDFEHFYRKVNADCITTHELDDEAEIKSTGVIEIDGENKVTSFEEKPQNPKSNLAVPPIYIYQEKTIPLIKQYINEGNNPDAPGNFIPWLIQHKSVHAFKFEGMRYDIGTLESYQKVQNLF
ncbi:nucleotidyltransferase family protein [Salipaludibacillus sp. HK11]|uniref:nucleotidyltransferase family protein n=1 Tax=Salipaludibacillus sp. HK11 TaxID=3394320 RepID=UPI0039FC92F9